uniref:Uncharacterized protein n=1 Tax=Anguilla anguilla TaxID=7936 RepID=A0A0E9T368_ANGAN
MNKHKQIVGFLMKKWCTFHRPVFEFTCRMLSITLSAYFTLMEYM